MTSARLSNSPAEQHSPAPPDPRCRQGCTAGTPLISDCLVQRGANWLETDAASLDARDDIADPIGVKGLGDVVMVGVPGAIVNAVYNATGKRITDLPVTIEKLL